MSIDGNGRRVAADPYRGTVAAVLECAANLACVGAEPLGTTNNLNFGNPEKPHIAWQLTESVRGLGDACRALQAPIVGGNVSLYNEGATGPIYPTPVIGMVGRLPDARRAGRLGFARAGDAIALVGPSPPRWPPSELAKLRGEPLPDGLRGDRPRGGPRRAGRRPRRGPRGRALERPRHRRGRPRGRAGRVLPGRRARRDVELASSRRSRCAGRRIRGASAALFGEGPGGFVVSGPSDALRALGERVPRRRTIGAVEGEALDGSEVARRAGRARRLRGHARRAARDAHARRSLRAVRHELLLACAR